MNFLSLDFPKNMNYHSVMSNNSFTAEENSPGRISRKRARTRAELLAAARKVFAAHGFHEASIAEITARADVGVGTFYLHFRDKEEIFATLLEDGLREMREVVVSTVEDQPLDQQLPILLRTIFQQAYLHRDLFQIALTDGGYLLQTRAKHARFEVAEGLTRILSRAEEIGLLAGYDLPLLARFITGMIMQGISWWFEYDEPGPDEMARRVLQLLGSGLPAPLLAYDEMR
jgi:AcrR family transcriptional regulator